MTTDSDALTIARWCWLEYAWREEGGCLECKMPDSVRGGHSWSKWQLSFNQYDGSEVAWGVGDAERVLIERGHAEAYGRALARHFGFRTPLIWDQDGTEHGIRLAMAATAPLAVRVKAMAATIRGLAPKETSA